MNKFTLFLFILSLGLINSAVAEMNIPIQLRLKSPSGTYPTEAGLSVKISILSPDTSCILREENFSGQTIINGGLSLSLGAGSRGVSDPALSLNQVYDNSKAKTGLSCVDVNDNIVSTGQVYSPAASDGRVIRILTTVSGDAILANFNMRATPYAIQAESVGGKVAADIITNNSATQMNQTNLNDLLLDVTRFNNLKNIALTGQAVSATTATNFSSALTGDVSGTQGATSVDRIKGVAVSSTAPAVGQVLQYDGTKYAPVTLAAGGAVTSVAGRTGAVVLTSGDISGLGGAAALNVGAAAGTVAEGDDSRIVNAFNDTQSATSLNVASTIVKRDASGNFSINSINASGDIDVSGSINGMAKMAAMSASPTTAGTTTAYTLSFGAATDANITTNTSGASVNFYVDAVNTGAATLKVAGAPAANLFSAFTNQAVAAGDLQIGYYSAFFDGANWVVNIPPRRFKTGAINWTTSSAITIAASGVNVGDYVTCSFTNDAGVAMTTTKYWRQSVLVRPGVIDVVGIMTGSPPAIKEISCLVQK